MCIDYGCTPEIIDCKEFYDGLYQDDYYFINIYSCKECSHCLCINWLDYNDVKNFDPCNDCNKEICPVVCRFYEQFQNSTLRQIA